jgi:SLT domain-containing protein
MPEQPTADELANWKNSKTGKWWFAWVEAETNMVSLPLIFGQSVNTDSVDATAIQTAAATGKLQALIKLRNSSYDDIVNIVNPKEEVEDESSVSTPEVGGGY